MQLRPPKSAMLALATVLFSVLPIPAQTIVESNISGAGFETPTSSAPTIQVYSRETIVDVLVTDAKGHPVRSLKQSDFTISEDGNHRPIRSFHEYDKDAPLASVLPLPPNTFTNASALPANGPVQILYINLPCPPLKPSPAVSYIADYLRTMPAGTLVAIFGFRDDIGLRLIHDFTTDGPHAAASIGVDNFNRVLPPCTIPSADPIAAADQIAAYVAGVHGRKNLIWSARPLLPILRDGGYSWGYDNLLDMARASIPPVNAPDMTLTNRLMDTYNIFTREQIAVYPFAAGGIAAPIAGPDPGRRITAGTGAQVGLAQMGSLMGIGTAHLAFEDIAEATGGAAIYNTNDFKGAVAKIVDDTSHYYTLSYIPPRPADDGHYHPISIKVDRPGLHLTYRSGYNDEHPAPPDAVLKVHMTQAAMGLGSLPATQLLFDVQVTPSAPSPVNLTRASDSRRVLPVDGKTPVAYDLLFKLPQTQITFSLSPDGTRNGSLEFDLGAYNSDGKLLTVRSQTLKLPLTSEEYRDFIERPFQFFLPIDLPSGEITLRVGVFDGTSNKAGTIEIPMTIGKPARIPKPEALEGTAAAKIDR